MKRIRLTEVELVNIIKHVINEVGERNNIPIPHYYNPAVSTRVAEKPRRILPQTRQKPKQQSKPQLQQQQSPQPQQQTNTFSQLYTPSDSILTQIKQFEGWHQGWQKDPKGLPTTGWGFLQTPQLKKRFPNGMTKPQADNYFYGEIIPSMTTTFRDSVPNITHYNQNQLDALFSLFYNIGPTGFTTKSPKLQRALASGDVPNILKEMNHGENDPAAPGLAKRRNFERQLFMTPV